MLALLTAGETRGEPVPAWSGTMCGCRDYPIAAGTCTTKDLVLDSDGTVIQPVPDSLEAKTVVSIGTINTCTWGWWPQTLRWARHGPTAAARLA